jgi:hypothetical protein
MGLRAGVELAQFPEEIDMLIHQIATPAAISAATVLPRFFCRKN